VSRTGWILAACASVALAHTSALEAQALRWVVDGSASRIRYDSATALNAPALASRLEWRRPSTFARLTGSVTGFEGAGWSMQSRGDVAGWLSPLASAPLLRLEVSGSGSASRHSSDFSALSARGDLRVHLAGRDLGAWAGAGATVAKNSLDSAAVDGIVPSIGVWGRRGPVRVTASYAHARIAGETFPEGNMIVSLSSGPLDLDAWGGVRRYPFDTLDRTESWFGATAAWWFTDRIAVVASGGQYATDVLQGLPGGDFVSIGVRFTRRRVRPVTPRVVLPFIVASERGRSSGVTFRLPAATRVEIAGDFNGWQPEPLTRDADGAWVFSTPLAPGVYRFNVRIDGERWVVPEDFPEVDDGFGDKVGLLIVSEGGA
jgi:hypothetical protein